MNTAKDLVKSVTNIPWNVFVCNHTNKHFKLYPHNASATIIICWKLFSSSNQHPFTIEASASVFVDHRIDLREDGYRSITGVDVIVNLTDSIRYVDVSKERSHKRKTSVFIRRLFGVPMSKSEIYNHSFPSVKKFSRCEIRFAM